MDSAGSPMDRFKDAMQRVYGPFEVLTPDQAKTWEPPSNPGAGGHRGRYLWTDAFGVVNFITLYRETSRPVYLELAKSLVRTVHDVLGRTRDGSQRLPKATDEHPLKGGLRIGKMDATGPDGDGQYHHYLTIWMFALNRLCLASGEKIYNDLAVQLAEAIHRSFLHHNPLGKHRMVWKVSMDLKSVLVGSEGHLDAATGYAVYNLIQRTAQRLDSSCVLNTEVEDYIDVMTRDDKNDLAPSHDTLDLGMGLWMAQLANEDGWAQDLGKESLANVRDVIDPVAARPASRRLAFREFGFCLGVKCYGAEQGILEEVRELIRFWEEYAESKDPNYGDEDLRPISLVMYAAALIPGGELPSSAMIYLVIADNEKHLLGTIFRFRRRSGRNRQRETRRVFSHGGSLVKEGAENVGHWGWRCGTYHLASSIDAFLSLASPELPQYQAVRRIPQHEILACIGSPKYVNMSSRSLSEQREVRLAQSIRGLRVSPQAERKLRPHRPESIAGNLPVGPSRKNIPEAWLLPRPPNSRAELTPKPSVRPLRGCPPKKQRGSSARTREAPRVMRLQPEWEHNADVAVEEGIWTELRPHFGKISIGDAFRPWGGHSGSTAQEPAITGPIWHLGTRHATFEGGRAPACRSAKAC